MRLRLFLPSLLLLAVAAAWSVFWIYAARETGRQLDRVVAEQARNGVRIVCRDRGIGGYPFRIEVRCADTVASVDSPDGTYVVDAAGLAAVAQLPNPNHLIFELASPIAVTLPDGTAVDGGFKALRASVHLVDGIPERVSLQVEDPALALKDRDGTTTGSLDAHLLDMFVRRSEGGAPGAYDVVSKLVAATSPLDAAALGGDKADLEVQLTGSHLDLLAGGATPEALRSFAGSGGRLHLVLLRLTQGAVVAQSQGDATVDASGYPSGAFDVTVVGLGKLVEALGRQGVPGLYGALALGKPATLDGKPAKTYALRLDAGRFSVGPLTVGRLSPLF